jgi:hypothetical protein
MNWVIFTENKRGLAAIDIKKQYGQHANISDRWNALDHRPDQNLKAGDCRDQFHDPQHASQPQHRDEVIILDWHQAYGHNREIKNIPGIPKVSLGRLAFSDDFDQHSHHENTEDDSVQRRKERVILLLELLVCLQPHHHADHDDDSKYEKGKPVGFRDAFTKCAHENNLKTRA